ncbi:MAG TPA: hypothetical protein VFT55_03915, partial [Planctomycetota bacterium]|nr:hypothetical protein [Planctomycetota bacterium]
MGWSTWLALGACVVATWFGWRLLWHMADDAYITYRYVSNAMLGRGLVWNPEPFLPVDGNTDFLWSMLLLATWKVTGLVPPEVANTFGLLFGCGTLFLLARAAALRPLPEPLRPWRWLVVALVLAFVASNRAFLASLSSGLGVAIFNFLLFAWVLLASSARTRGAQRRWLLLGACAGACGVARPEGHLVVLATCVLVSLWGFPSRAGLRAAGAAVALAVLPELAHLLWRRLTVGDWMPCSYHAKTVEAWPESGARFFGSFVVEFGVYVWLAVALAWLVKKVRHPGPLALLRREHLGGAAVASVLLFHFGYYTFFMGGDLFEWRVYSHLIPLLPLV